MSDQKTEAVVTMYDRITDPMEAIKLMGEWISKSGLFGCDKIEQGMVLAMTAYAERRPVTDICRRYHIMDGKLSMKSEAMLAEFNERGGVHFWEKTDNKEAVLLLTKGAFKNFKVTYTIEDAERAGLCGKDGAMRSGQKNPGNWQHRPANMLRARVISNGVGMVDPNVRVGISTPEEIVDMRVETVQAAPARSLLAPPKPPTPDFITPPEVLPPVPTGALGKPKDKPAKSVKTSEPPKAEEVPTAMKLADAIEGMTGDANDWLIDKGWIKAKQTFRDLPEKKMQEILGRLQNFKLAVKTWKATKKEVK